MAQKKSHKLSDVSDLLPSTVPKWEVDPRDGTHRVVCGDAFGPWCAYQQIATLKIGTVVYLAATDYYHGGIPTGVVFMAKVVKS